MSYFYGIFGFVLREIYLVIDNYGVSLILFTLIARLLMTPTTLMQQKGTAKTQRMQTKVRKIQQQYAGDQKKIQEETQALYSREGQNPMNMGCAPLLIQLPIIWGLIGVIYRPLTFVLNIDETSVSALTEAVKTMIDSTAQSDRTIELSVIDNIDKLRSVVSPAVYNKISSFDFNFLGLPLGQTPSMKDFSSLWIVPILSGLSSFATSLFTFFKQKQTNPDMAKNPAMGCMSFGMPLFSFYFTFKFPVGIGIYWIASNVFAFVQTVIISLTHNPKKMLAKLLVEETIQRRSKEENLKRVAGMNK